MPGTATTESTVEPCSNTTYTAPVGLIHTSAMYCDDPTCRPMKSVYDPLPVGSALIDIVALRSTSVDDTEFSLAVLVEPAARFICPVPPLTERLAEFPVMVQ